MSTAQTESARPTSSYVMAFSGLCALLVSLGLGRFAFSPLIPLLVEAKWFSTAEADYLGATNLAGYVAGSTCAKRLEHFIGLGLLIKSALAAAVLCFFACSQQFNFLWFFFWRFLSGFTGGILMILASSAILSQTPKEKRGRTAGIIFTGLGAGIALSATLIPALAHAGLTVVWLSLGLFSAVLSALAWRFLPTQAPDDTGSLRLPQQNARLSRPLFLVLVGYVAAAIGFVPHTVFWVDYIARGLGKGIATGSQYWLMLGIAAACGPLLAGWLADRIGFARSLQLSLLCNAAAVALPCVSTHPAELTFSSIGAGGITMGITSLTASRVAELVPPVQQKQVWSWMTIAFSLAYAGGAYLFSFLFAQTASYRLLFAIAAAAVLVGGLSGSVSPTDRR